MDPDDPLPPMEPPLRWRRLAWTLPNVLAPLCASLGVMLDHPVATPAMLDTALGLVVVGVAVAFLRAIREGGWARMLELVGSAWVGLLAGSLVWVLVPGRSSESAAYGAGLLLLLVFPSVAIGYTVLTSVVFGVAEAVRRHVRREVERALREREGLGR